MTKHEKILLTIECLILLLLLVRCFRPETHVLSLEGGAMTEMMEQEDGSILYEGESFSLKPGVYRVEMRSNVRDEQKIYVEINCERSGYQALRGNGVNVYPNQKYSSFEIFVTDKIEDAYVTCALYGGREELLGQIDIYRTAAGSRVLFTIVLFCFLAFDILMKFRRRALLGKISRKTQIVCFSLAVGVLLSCFPYFTDYFSFGADTIFHLQRIECLKNTLLLNFDFPVRVQNTWIYGHGYMVSVFYGDLFLMFPALLRLIGFPIVTAYKIFVFAVMALTAVITYVSLQRCVKNEKAALFGALIYLLAPYRLYNFYNRGAVGEYLAMTFMPLVCCGMYLLLSEETDSEHYKNYKWYMVGGMSAILQSHLLSTEMTAFFVAIVCLAAWRRVFRKETFIQLLQAVGLVAALNCWLWLPMLCMLRTGEFMVSNVFESQIQQIGIWFARLVQWVPNSGTTHLGIKSADAIQIGVAATLILMLYGVLRWKKEIGKTKRELLLLLGLTLLSVVMSTKYFPWDMLAQIPGVRFFATSLQFPTRLMAPATVFSSWFAAFFILQLEEEKREQLAKGVFAFFLALAVFAGMYQVNSISSRSVASYFYTAENTGTISVGNGEYLIDGTWVRDYFYHDPVAEDGLVWSDYEKKGTDISIIVRNTTPTDKCLDVPLIGYPGYMAVGESGLKEPYIASERGEHEDLRVVIPAGYEGTISISYEGPLIFKVSELISAVSLCLLFVRMAWKGRKACQKK